MQRTHIATLVLALACLVYSAASTAQEDPISQLTDAEAEQVLQLLRDAEQSREAGDCGAALARYTDIGDIVWVAQVRMRAARCYEQLGQFAAADDALLEVIARTEGDIADDAAAALAELYAAHPAILDITVSGQAAEVFVDDDAVGVLHDERAEFQLAPGTHAVRVVSPGHEPVAVPFDARVGERVTHSLAFATVAPVAPAEASEAPLRRERRVVAPIILGGASVASLATAAAFWGRSDERYEAWQRELASADPSLGRLNTLEAQSGDAARNGNIMAGVGAGLAAAAIVTVLIPKHERQGPDVSVAPSWGTRGTGAAVHVRW